MNMIENIREQYQQLHSGNSNGILLPVEQQAYQVFNEMGVPGARNEEWKYTRIGNLFNREFVFTQGARHIPLMAQDVGQVRLPGAENANELVFVNGAYSAELSNIFSADLEILSLQEAAAGKYRDVVGEHLGHSSRYHRDGIHALNTAFARGGIFINIPKGRIIEHPVYVYHITDARSESVFSQPRSLIIVGENSQVQFVETYATIGMSESFLNQVVEVVLHQDALVEYYKIENDAAQTHQVNTTHFRQVGKSVLHTVTVSLNGGIVRNNLNIALEAEHSEAHMYGLYFLQGSTHVDNHTVADHLKPNCQSNEMYKGIIDDHATAVFNGKIFVQPDAQKTNAFQSNKNILLSDAATVNTKPQLEIFADDVKCSHGCTVGQLDDEALFYLQSRGVSRRIALSLLVHAFAVDVLEHIRLEPVRNYVDQLISERLEFNIQ
ncbi:MAG TPA: Fe-S cluster assembly protein SufD [Flavisolibacter sp.]